MHYSQILREQFKAYAEANLNTTKSLVGTSLAVIKQSFTAYLNANNAPITEVSSIQMGLLMSGNYIRRKTAKGSHYLVTLSTPVINI